MQEIEEIIVMMGYCAKPGGDACTMCAYKDKSGNGVSCRQHLLLDAMKALQDKALKCAELEASLEENRRSVCFEEEKARTPVGEAVGALTRVIQDAAYWRGQTDALKWWIRGYFGEKWPQEGGVMEDV